MRISLIKYFTFIGCVMLVCCSLSSCTNPTSGNSNSKSAENTELTAPSVTLYSQSSGEVFFMMQIDSVSVGDKPIEYWVYYNTDGSDTKNYYGILSSDRTIKGLKSGITITFFVRKYCDGSFSPFSNKESIQVK